MWNELMKLGQVGQVGLLPQREAQTVEPPPLMFAERRPVPFRSSWLAENPEPEPTPVAPPPPLPASAPVPTSLDQVGGLPKPAGSPVLPNVDIATSMAVAMEKGRTGKSLEELYRNRGYSVSDSNASKADLFKDMERNLVLRAAKYHDPNAFKNLAMLHPGENIDDIMSGNTRREREQRMLDIGREDMAYRRSLDERNRTDRLAEAKLAREGRLAEIGATQAGAQAQAAIQANLQREIATANNALRSREIGVQEHQQRVAAAQTEAQSRIATAQLELQKLAHEETVKQNAFTRTTQAGMLGSQVNPEQQAMLSAFEKEALKDPDIYMPDVTKNVIAGKPVVLSTPKAIRRELRAVGAESKPFERLSELTKQVISENRDVLLAGGVSAEKIQGALRPLLAQKLSELGMRPDLATQMASAYMANMTVTK